MQLTPTTTINIDQEDFKVELMSDEVRRLVQLLDEWRQDESDQSGQLLKTRAALRDIQNTLLQQIQHEKAEAEAEGAEKATEAGEVLAEAE